MVLKATSAAAATMTVGGSDGWTVLSSRDFYSSWASKRAFTVGDTLVFNYTTGFHTVAMVTSKDAYDKCDKTVDKNAQLFTVGPTKIPLTTTGSVFFFCTISTHCQDGMKFAVAPVSANGPEMSVEPKVPSGDYPKGNAASVVPSAVTFSVSLVAFLFMALLF